MKTTIQFSFRSVYILTEALTQLNVQICFFHSRFLHTVEWPKIMARSSGVQIVVVQLP